MTTATPAGNSASSASANVGADCSDANSPKTNRSQANRPKLEDGQVNGKALAKLDDKLSKRYIELDPDGYFLIYLDGEAGLICAKHFTNTINEKGLACDPETGEPLCVKGQKVRSHTQVFTGRTAKELCIKIFEDKNNPCPISYLDHAAYLGREFVRAEIALVNGTEYVQD